MRWNLASYYPDGQRTLDSCDIRGPLRSMLIQKQTTLERLGGVVVYREVDEYGEKLTVVMPSGELYRHAVYQSDG